MNKVKIFTHAHANDISKAFDALEVDINKWLEDNNFNIKEIKEANASFEGKLAIVFVFYELS